MQSVSDGSGPQVTSHSLYTRVPKLGWVHLGMLSGTSCLLGFLPHWWPSLPACAPDLWLPAAAQPQECCWGSRAHTALSKGQGCSQRSCSLTLSHLKPRDVCGGPDGQEGVLGDGTRLAQRLAGRRLAVEGAVEAAGSPGWEHWEPSLVSQAGTIPALQDTRTEYSWPWCHACLNCPAAVWGHM